MKMLAAAVVIVSLFFSIHAETYIADDISGMTLDMSGNPFIVEQDIVVPEGKKVTIQEGCIFLFKPFTGFTVKGQLVVSGTQNRPVIFSSFNDGEYNPQSEQLANPFDWNGIFVLRESGNVSFSYIGLRFSVYGIKSQNSNIQIINGVFRQNGQFHFTINDNIQFVQDNIPYTYNASKDTQDDTTSKPSVTPNTSRQSSSKKIAVRYVTFGVGVIGTVTGIVFGAQIPGAYQSYWDAGEGVGDYNSSEKSFYTKIIGASLGGVIGLTGFTIFGLTFRK